MIISVTLDYYLIQRLLALSTVGELVENGGLGAAQADAQTTSSARRPSPIQPQAGLRQLHHVQGASDGFCPAQWLPVVVTIS